MGGLGDPQMELLVPVTEVLGVGTGGFEPLQRLAQPFHIPGRGVDHREPRRMALHRQPHLDQLEGAGDLGDILFAIRRIVDVCAAADAAGHQTGFLEPAEGLADSAARGSEHLRQITLRRQPFAVAVGAVEDRLAKPRGDRS